VAAFRATFAALAAAEEAEFLAQKAQAQAAAAAQLE